MDHSPSQTGEHATSEAISLITVFKALGASVELGGSAPLKATKDHCFVHYTSNGWNLYRGASDPRGRFYVEGCTLEEALLLIRDGTVPRETEVLTDREQARRILSDAIRDNFGTEGPQAEQLFEALDKLSA